MFFGLEDDDDNTPGADHDANEVKCVPGVWIGSKKVASNKEFLQTHNITHILVVGAMLPKHFENDFTYKSIFCLDTVKQNLLAYFEACNEFIMEGRKKGGVFIHCQYGRSRSATVTIAYIMKELKKSYEEAYEDVEKARPCICPNDGFIKQLRLYQAMGCKIDENNADYKKLLETTMP